MNPKDLGSRDSLEQRAVLRWGVGRRWRRGLERRQHQDNPGDPSAWGGNSQVSNSFFQELVFVAGDSALLWPHQESNLCPRPTLALELPGSS